MRRTPPRPSLPPPHHPPRLRPPAAVLEGPLSQARTSTSPTSLLKALRPTTWTLMMTTHVRKPATAPRLWLHTTAQKPRPTSLLANVGKGAPSHITILQTTFTENMDIVCIQEPYTHPGTKTQNHPGFDCYAPVDSWDSEDPIQ